MGNSRVKDRFGVALDGKQVLAFGIGVTVLVAGVFVLGMNLGKRSVVTAVIAAPRDPLAHLDEPLPVREDTVELKAHQALTDARSIDKSLPVPQMKATTVAIAHPPEPALPDAPVLTPAPREERVAAPPAAAPARPAAPRPDKKVAAPVKRGAYAIQVASLTKRSEAEKIAKQYGKRSPRIVEANVPGKGHCFRVLLGSYETQDAAKRQLATLSRAGVKGMVTAVR